MAQTAAVPVHFPGERIDHTPGSAVTPGQVVEIGGHAFVADVAIAANTLGSLPAVGVFDVPKASGEIAAGADVYWDNNGTPNVGDASSGAATGTATGNTQLGMAVAVALTGATYVRVMKRTAANSTAVPVYGVEAVTAAGTAQANATAVGAATTLAIVTGTNGTLSVKLPAGLGNGTCIVVKNIETNVLKVFPGSGEAINALSLNTAISMANNTIATFFKGNLTTWYTHPLLPS